MKRKTNLFYTSGPDSKFITFSNYTESLTGNFLSTDTKIYPSKFLCINMENLDEVSKELVIKYLVAYYENKLALLTDKLIEDNKIVEQYMMPLNYLLEALCRISIKKSDNNSSEFKNENVRNLIRLLSLINYTDNLEETFLTGIINDFKKYLAALNINIDDNIYTLEFKEYDQNYEENGEIITRDPLKSLSIIWHYTEQVPNNKPIYKESSIIDFIYKHDKNTDIDVFIKSHSNTIMFETDETTEELLQNIIANLGLTKDTTKVDGYYNFNTSYSDNSNTWKVITKDSIYELLIQQGDFDPDNLNIVYIGDVTEFDYNGTYTDTICSIDLYDFVQGKIEIDENNYYETDSYSYYTDEILYNWEQGVPYEYSNVKPIYDSTVKYNNENHYIYNYSSKISGIKLESYNNGDEDQDITIDSITFNMLIPLFDVTNINYKKSQDELIVGENYINLSNENIDTSDDKLLYCNNVPLGIWFAPEPIKLFIDTETGHSQSWSLQISSQFKPFPYSTKDVKESEYSKIGNSFNTFAQILRKQNEILNAFQYYNIKILEIENKLNAITSKINDGTIINTAVDNISKNEYKFETSMVKKFEEFKDYIISYIKNLTWTSSI